MVISKVINKVITEVFDQVISKVVWKSKLIETERKLPRVKKQMVMIKKQT